MTQEEKNGRRSKLQWTALSGLDLIKAYREHPERYLPMPDHPGQMPKINEYGEVNLGWNAGLLEENRPFFVECWAWEHITMLTFYASTRGIEDLSGEDILALIQDSGYFCFREGVQQSPQYDTFSDRQGGEFFSMTITVGIDEEPLQITGAPIKPWAVLNAFNRETLK